MGLKCVDAVLVRRLELDVPSHSTNAISQPLFVTVQGRCYIRRSLLEYEKLRDRHPDTQTDECPPVRRDTQPHASRRDHANSYHPPIPVSASIGVPDVLVALFDGAREFAPREMVPGGGGGRSAQSSSGGLCSTLKTLLMSPSYRVRSATARLIASLCNDHRFSEEPAAAHENAATGRGGRNGACLFFRETMVAAGATGKVCSSCRFNQRQN